MHGCTVVGVVRQYMLELSEQLQDAQSVSGMMSGMGPNGGDLDMIGSVGNAAQVGGGMVMYDTGRSPLAARRTVGTRPME
jgi:hypothetical protein